jgi:hypothetical protein
MKKKLMDHDQDAVHAQIEALWQKKVFFTEREKIQR